MFLSKNFLRENYESEMFSSPAFFAAYQVQIGLVKVRKCRETRPNLCLDNYDLLQYLVLSNMGQFAAKISLKLKVAPRSNIALLIKIQWVSKLLLTNGLLLSFIHSDSIDKIFVLTGAIICSALEKKIVRVCIRVRAIFSFWDIKKLTWALI